jgi:hypothetical protein
LAVLIALRCQIAQKPGFIFIGSNLGYDKIARGKITTDSAIRQHGLGQAEEGIAEIRQGLDAAIATGNMVKHRPSTL